LFFEVSGGKHEMLQNCQVLVKLGKLIEIGGKKQRSEIHMPINVLRNKNELPQKWKECTDC
jgi:hypothetical protein